MDKIILVDGNNLLFRSYYATAYNGNFMKNSKGFPTNGLLGFCNMINKILLEEKPQYMMVAFDKGKTFRHEKYKDYKAGRIETPNELLQQFPVAKQLLTEMGIKYYEIDNYEADDIIGTFARYCEEDPNFEGTIISSDRDLLQLISPSIDIKLLKSKDYIRYNEQTFEEAYGIKPIHIIDLKALQGDTSDHIPGVRGIGEKTALKLLQQYETLDGVYAHLEEVTPKLKTNLEEDRASAYMSYELATIIKTVPIPFDKEEISYKGPYHARLNRLYEDLEFYSFLKRDEIGKDYKPFDIKIAQSIDDIKVEGNCACYLEILGTNYHTSKVLGMAVYNETTSLFIPLPLLKENPSFLTENKIYTYDAKKVTVALRWQGIDIQNICFDTMIAAYLLDYNIKDDIAYLANQFEADIPFYESIYNETKTSFVEPNIDVIAYNTMIKAQFIYESYEKFYGELVKEDLIDLFHEIELPLAFVLGDMEYNGVLIDKEELLNMGEDMKIKIELLSADIYNDAGETFNIASPKQLGEILFEKLGLSHGKKNHRGYSTSIDVLNKLSSEHPIINKIIEYRMFTKLHATYIEGLLGTVMPDGKIHTIYTQTLTRTGRLSSIEPNLQNIPVRSEYGKLIRKAFVPSPNSIILSGDYSQIELRVMAHMANIDSLIDAFKNDMDIHTKTAMDIFHVSKDEVTSSMRRMAKAVNFGIIYGISSFGLSENLTISVKEAKKFIEDYLQTYPGVKEYMDSIVAKAYEDGFVKTLLHRKRMIPELKNSNYMIRAQGERIALNTPIQGTSADIIKKAMVEIHDAFKREGLKSKMILQVHDELVFDCLKEERETVIRMITNIMENTYKVSVPLKVDIEYGDNWYQAK